MLRINYKTQTDKQLREMVANFDEMWRKYPSASVWNTYAQGARNELRRRNG